jgi:biopolymer transport protein ExbB
MKHNSKIAVVSLFLMCVCLAAHPAFAQSAAGGLSATASSQSAEKGVTLWELLQAGGIAMVVLGLLSIAALALVVYNFMTIKTEQLAPQRFTEDLIQRLESRDDKGVRSMCSGKANIMAIIAWEGFERRNRGKLIVREAMENAARREIGKLWQNISYLGDIATIAPLLGLLGTTLGMIQAFNVISFAGANLKPIMLVGGISKALVTTAAGLIIAVPVLSFYSYFRGKVQDISDQVERYSMDVIKLIEESATSSKNF